MDAFDFLKKVLNHDFEKFLVWMGWQFLKDIGKMWEPYGTVAIFQVGLGRFIEFQIGHSKIWIMIFNFLPIIMFKYAQFHDQRMYFHN